MRWIVRAFLVWVLALALPLQGLAASAMLPCGPGHGPTAVEPSPSGHGPSGRHEHPAHDGHRHIHPAAVDLDGRVAEAGAPVQVLQHNTSSDAAQQGHHSCSACAACCIWMALPSSLALPDPQPAVQTLHPGLALMGSSHQPAGLDRPPRPLLA